MSELIILSELDIENLPNHKVKNSNEWASSCPMCPLSGDSNKDRFIFTVDKGAYWCRQCGFAGYVDQKAQITLTDDQRADMERQARQRRQTEIDRKRTALQTLQIKRNDLVYHRNLNGKTDYVKRKWGLADDTIDRFNVGYCHGCPTSPYSDSITIPYYQQDSLVNIRHRLTSPNGQGKYRPEMAGLPSSIFNVDSLQDDGWIILVEGEFKTMVLWQYGFPVVGSPGTSFKADWVSLFANVELVYIALDPGAETQALKAGGLLTNGGVDVRLVTLPHKPDDFFVIHGGTDREFCDFLEKGRTYQQALRGDTQRWTRQYRGFGKLRN